MNLRKDHYCPTLGRDGPRGVSTDHALVGPARRRACWTRPVWRSGRRRGRALHAREWRTPVRAARPTGPSADRTSSGGTSVRDRSVRARGDQAERDRAGGASPVAREGPRREPHSPVVRGTRADGRGKSDGWGQWPDSFPGGVGARLRCPISREGPRHEPHSPVVRGTRADGRGKSDGWGQWPESSPGVGRVHSRRDAGACGRPAPARYRPSTFGRPAGSPERASGSSSSCVREAQRTRPVRQLARPPAVHGTTVDGGAAGGRGSSPGSSSFFLHVFDPVVVVGGVVDLAGVGRRKAAVVRTTLSGGSLGS